MILNIRFFKETSSINNTFVMADTIRVIIIQSLKLGKHQSERDRGLFRRPDRSPNLVSATYSLLKDPVKVA